MKKVIGLTGGVASGKSTVSRFLDDFGANIIDVDKVGHDILLRPEVVEIIGNTFENVIKDSVVSRQALGSIVFSNKEKLDELNNIMYPLMKEEILRRISDGINIVDMAILFESGFDLICDEVIVVHSTVKNQIERMEMRGYDEDKINGILASQMDPLLKVKRASYVIHNDESIDVLHRKVRYLYNYLMENLYEHKSARINTTS